MFAKDLYDFVELLNKHRAEYLIVGGYAVGNYGYPRATGDLDVWLNPVKENYPKIKNVVVEFGFPASNFLTEKANYVSYGKPSSQNRNTDGYFRSEFPGSIQEQI